jgi:PmbA protein
LALALLVGKDYPKTRIVIMSGHEHQLERALGLSDLVYKVVSKPFTIATAVPVSRSTAMPGTDRMSGPSIARGTSFLKDKMGAKLFANGIRIIDDPLLIRGVRSHPFDGEGVAAKKLALVEDGILSSWLLDSATARELGLVTTGHAQRGASSVPSPGSTNLHMEPGQLSPDALIADITDGFYVTDLIGSGANMVTGDYSRGASGFWIENGKLTYPVSEVTIAGHLLEMFRTLTPADDLEFRYGTNAPTLRVEGLTVAGQ